MGVLLLEEQALGQAESGSSVAGSVSQGCTDVLGKETLSVLLSVSSLRPLCFVFPLWVFREPSKRRRDLLA